jgi:hypothetical protein
MVGDPYSPFLVQEGQLRQHAVERASELVEDIGGDRTAFPAREVVAGDAVAKPKSGDLIADLDDLPSAVAERYDSGACAKGVRATQDEQIALIQRRSAYPDDDFMRAWIRRLALPLNDAAGVSGFLELVGTHGSPL